MDFKSYLYFSNTINLVVDGKYTFTNVLPGPYEITIPQSNLCFESTRVLLNVASASEIAPDFVQHGYEVNIISSHRAIVSIIFLFRLINNIYIIRIV